MRHERQLEFLDRLARSGPDNTGLFSDHSYTEPASGYTDAERFSREVQHLFRAGPVLVGLSAECKEPGTYIAADFGGVPVLVIRQPDHSLRAMVNACRHRGAPLAEGCGAGLRRLVCGYHGWTYDLDGRLVTRPVTHGAFNDVGPSDLVPVAVAERYGLIFVRPSSAAPIDVDEFLAGAQDDLSSFALSDYILVETRQSAWKMNWKLVLDTFGESYHIRTLHRTSIAPAFDSGCTLFEPFGRHLVNIGFRKNIVNEFAKPEGDRSLLPYGTIQYFLLPNALLTHQIDHIELWRVTPIDVRTTHVTTSVFAPGPIVSEKAAAYFRKNLDVLLDVTSQEDFPLMERIQRTLDSGALPHVVFGRNEAALAHFHQSVDAAIAGGRPA